jgi:hypothetical protein
LSGEYRVDKITYEQIDNTQNPNQMVYFPGDLYVNPYELEPFDSIQVGFFKLHMDYGVIRFAPTEMPDGSTQWGKQYFYDVYNQTNGYLGDMIIDFEGSRRVFSIIDDGLESLVLRSKGQWAYGSAGSNESITLYLTRVGP